MDFPLGVGFDGCYVVYKGDKRDDEVVCRDGGLEGRYKFTSSDTAVAKGERWQGFVRLRGCDKLYGSFSIRRVE